MVKATSCNATQDTLIAAVIAISQVGYHHQAVVIKRHRSWVTCILNEPLSSCWEVVLQVQEGIHEQGQAPDSPLQRPSASSSPRHSLHPAEEYSLGVSDADQAEQGSIAVLVHEAADAMHQVQCAFCFL